MNSGHRELQYERKSCLNWKWGRCSSNRCKTILLRWEFLERLANFFRLVLACSFSILSRWFLTWTNQLISTSSSTITSQKQSIKQINFLQCYSNNKFWHFDSISRKFLSHFLSKSFDVPPTQYFSFSSKPFGINWKDLQISKTL